MNYANFKTLRHCPALWVKPALRWPSTIRLGRGTGALEVLGAEKQLPWLRLWCCINLGGTKFPDHIHKTGFELMPPELMAIQSLLKKNLRS